MRSAYDPVINPSLAVEAGNAMVKTLEDSTLLDHDYVTGKPPHYERREDGSIVLASLDWDQTGDPATFKVRCELP